MHRIRNQTVVILLALCGLLLITHAQVAQADVDLLLTVRSPTGDPTGAQPGDTILVDLIAQADPAQNFTGLNAIIEYDPTYWELVGFDDQYTGYTPGWFSSGFLNNSDGLNDDLADGDAIYTAVALIGTPAQAVPSPGLVVTTFEFMVITGPPAPQTPCDGTDLAFLATFGASSETEVVNVIADVTGDISDTTTIFVLCSPNDADGDLICDELDNCPSDENPCQEDTDSDEVGDVCDNCPDDPNADQSDVDSDGAGDVCDICAISFNATQVVGDVDGNGVLDVADLTPFLDVLLGLDLDPAHLGASDVNCDGVANGGDIQDMVDVLLAPI